MENIVINDKIDTQTIREIFFKNIIRKVSTMLKNYSWNYFLRKRINIRQNLKFSNLNKQEIVERVSLLKKIDKDLPEIKVEQISKNTYLLNS